MSENNGIMPASLADRDLYREQWVDKTVEEIKKQSTSTRFSMRLSRLS